MVEANNPEARKPVFGSYHAARMTAGLFTTPSKFLNASKETRTVHATFAAIVDVLHRS